MDGDQTVAVVKDGMVDHWNIVANGVAGRYEPGSGNKFYYIKDHLGSTRAVVNSSGTVVEAHDYYPFGLLMPARDYQSGSETKEKFTGKERDGETGLHWFNPGRYYPATFGRWQAPDLFNDVQPSLSPYHYVSNDPIGRFDPDGMQDTPVYAGPPVIIEAPRYEPSRYELYYHPSIGGVRYGEGLGAYHNRALEDLGSFVNWGLSLSFSAMGAGSTIHSGLASGKQGVLSSGLRKTFVVTKGGRIRYLTRFNYGLSKYTKPMARVWLARNMAFYRSIGRFGFWAGVGLSVLNVALAEDPRAKWQAAFSGVFGALGGAGGAFLGSFATPVAGTIAGGIAGAAFGDWVGNRLGNLFYDAFVDKR